MKLTRDGGQNNTTQTTQYQQGTGPPVKAGRGGLGMRMIEAVRGRKGPSDKITPGNNREPDASQGSQRGDNLMREGSHMLVRGNPWAAQNGREAQKSVGGRWVGAPSR